MADPDKLALLRAYVNEGGKLYITDLSYDFVEQAFPEYIDFLGSDDVLETMPEWADEAEWGTGGITSNATVNDSQLTSWLNNVTCEGGSCRNSDGTVRVTGFADGWGVMNGIHTGAAASTKGWVTGPVGWGFDESGNKPLTILFNHGAGKVLYSSYHVVTESPSSGFWPQERILQYFIFEM